MNLLIIEDNELDYLLIKEALSEMQDISVDAKNAVTFDQAADMLARDHFDIIITDLGLPESSGLSTIEKIRRLHWQIPLIVITGLNDKETALNALKLGAQDYLVKGRIDSEILERSIRYSLERFKFELDIKDSEKKYRQIVDNALVGVYKGTDKGKITFVNDALALMLGFENKFELMKSKIVEYPLNRDSFDKIISACLAYGRVKDFEMPIYGNGRIYHTLHNATLTGSEISGMMIDITDRKTATELLLEIETKQNAILRALPDAMLLLDENYVVTDYYLPEGKFGGFLELPLQEKNIVDIFQYELLKKIELAIKTLENNGLQIINHHYIKQVIDKHFEIRVKKFGGSQIILLIRDISQRKKMEQVIINTQKMEAIGKLAGGIAHEFNNMMTAIINYSEILSLKTDSTHNMAADISPKIKETAISASKLASQLLAYSSKQMINPKALNFNEVISKLEPTLKKIISGDIDLIFNPDHNLLDVILDRQQFEQILVNLLMNSNEAIRDKGRIIISTFSTYIDGKRAYIRKKHVSGIFSAISIEDTGKGIDDSIKDKIFDPFFTTKYNGKGSGLGLSVVYGIVLQNDGWLDLETTEGSGAKFTLYFPVAGNPENVPENTNSGREGHGRYKILIVDDNREVLDSISRILGRKGHSILKAETGAEAETMFYTDIKTIDFVLTDILLPDTNGITLAEKLRKMNPETRIILCSASNDPKVLDSIGPNTAFIEKPYQIQELIELFQSLK
ncbi:MAG: response regulator [Candidatus Kapaibacterium sp.]